MIMLIATGITTSVKDFCEIAFSHAGLRASGLRQS